MSLDRAESASSVPVRRAAIRSQPLRFRRAIVFLLLLGAAVSVGCAGQRPSTARPLEAGSGLPEPMRLPPSDLQAEHVTGGFALTWQTNRGEESPISGYNIYLSPEKSVRNLSPASPEVMQCQWAGLTYPGDTDPRTDVERVELPDLEYGVTYFVHVRTVYADGSIGGPSEEFSVIPRPFGRLRLAPRFAGETDGFSFAALTPVSARDERNDVYLFTRHDSVFAASPHRLDRSQRYAEFFVAGPSVSIADYPTWQSHGKGETTVHLQPGWTFILSTPEGCLAKLRVAQIEGVGENVTVTMDFVYQPRRGIGVF